MLRGIRWVAAATSAMVVALLPVQGAAGEQMRAVDPARDVVAVRIDAGPNLEHRAVLKPRRKHGDLISLQAAYPNRQVIVDMSFRKVKPTGRMFHTVVLRTESRRFRLDIEHTGRRVTSETLSGAGRDGCTRLEVRVNLEHDRLKSLVPRPCLDGPRWVRVGAETYLGGRCGDFCYDDARRRGRNDPDWRFVGPILGPRLQRG